RRTSRPKRRANAANAYRALPVRRKTIMVRKPHDELAIYRRGAQQFGSARENARTRAAIALRRGRSSRPSKRDRSKEALSRTGVPLFVRLLRRRAPFLGGRRVQPDDRGASSARIAGDHRGHPLR